jgi:hypothetical protein
MSIETLAMDIVSMEDMVTTATMIAARTISLMWTTAPCSEPTISFDDDVFMTSNPGDFPFGYSSDINTSEDLIRNRLHTWGGQAWSSL